MERFGKTGDEALFGEGPVAQLVALLVDDDADDRPELLEHPSPSNQQERRRVLDVEHSSTQVAV